MASRHIANPLCNSHFYLGIGNGWMRFTFYSDDIPTSLYLYVVSVWKCFFVPLVHYFLHVFQCSLNLSVCENNMHTNYTANKHTKEINCTFYSKHDVNQSFVLSPFTARSSTWTFFSNIKSLPHDHRCYNSLRVGISTRIFCIVE